MTHNVATNTIQYKKLWTKVTSKRLFSKAKKMKLYAYHRMFLQVSGLEREAIISGAPLEKSSKFGAPSLRVITDIRCRLEANVNCLMMAISLVIGWKDKIRPSNTHNLFSFPQQSKESCANTMSNLWFLYKYILHFLQCFFKILTICI